MPLYDFVIATYNSEPRLAKTLEALHQTILDSSVSEQDVNIIVVNNGSTDNTLEIAQSYTDKMPLTVVDAPEAGKSKALNHAIEHYVRGDVLFITDDDTAFAKGWLDHFVAAINSNPDYGVFAGRIVAKWERELDPRLASWIPMGSTYAVHERDTSGPCDPGLVWGPNKAVRRDVLEAGVRFDERIGPMPTPLYAMGEDSGFAMAADKLGFKSYFVADAIVEHTIKAETANEDWIIKRAERLGYGIFAIRTPSEYERKWPSFIPLDLELLGNSLFWGYIIYPLTFLMPASKHRFWFRWRKYYYRGLLQSYNAFVKK